MTDDSPPEDRDAEDAPGGRDAGDPREDRADSSPDRRDDPFDELDVDREVERGGDPFERLSDDDGGDSDPDPFEYRETEGPTAGTDRGGSAGASDREGSAGTDEESGASGPPGEAVDVAADPLGDVDVSRGDPFESADSPFEQVDVGDVDPDAVWAQFTDDGEAGSGVASGPETLTGPDSTGEPGHDVVEVSKHSFCEGCPHFSPPPEVACGHQGTEILEFVGMEDVRISNCPVVVEQRELGEME